MELNTFVLTDWLLLSLIWPHLVAEGGRINILKYPKRGIRDFGGFIWKMLGGMSIIVVACSVQKIYILFNNIILFLWRFKSKNFKDLNLWRQNLWRPKTYEKWLPGTVFILKLMRYLIGEFVSYLSHPRVFNPNILWD